MEGATEKILLTLVEDGKADFVQREQCQGLWQSGSSVDKRGVGWGSVGGKY